MDLNEITIAIVLATVSILSTIAKSVWDWRNADAKKDTLVAQATKDVSEAYAKVMETLEKRVSAMATALAAEREQRVIYQRKVQNLEEQAIEDRQNWTAKYERQGKDLAETKASENSLRELVNALLEDGAATAKVMAKRELRYQKIDAVIAAANGELAEVLGLKKEKVEAKT